MVEQTDLAVEELRASVVRAQTLLDEVMRRTAGLQEARAEGRSYSEIVRTEDRPLVVEIVTDVLDELAAAGSAFRRAEARVLHDEGMSQESIAVLFGVTRQRVSVLLKSPRAPLG